MINEQAAKSAIDRRKYLVEGSIASKNDMRILDLNDTLTQAQQIRADTDGAARDHRNCDNLVVGLGSFTGNHTGVAQILYADAVLFADDSSDLVAAKFAFVSKHRRQIFS